jgi:hypothetical protein
VSEYANLSNGILCAPSPWNATRIQSTWCEQKRWEDILWTIPVSLYVEAANGIPIIVHDQSERSRLTRAQWQGLSMLRHVLRRAWGLPIHPEFSRGGHNVTAYWDYVYDHVLSDRVKRYLRYFNGGAAPLSIKPCGCQRVAAAAELAELAA